MALRELELPSRSSGLKPRGSNSIPDCLHRDGTCTWSLILSHHSLEIGTIHKLLPCYSDGNVSVFKLGRAFRSSGSGSVGNDPRCSMTLAQSENCAAMNVEHFSCDFDSVSSKTFQGCLAKSRHVACKMMLPGFEISRH